MVAKRGVFITLEGGEGAGKSTAASGLAAKLREEGQEVLLTREPGGTKGAEAIRALLLNQDIPLDPLAQTMLHFAARADHVAHSIRPALARGAVVICDRFYDSTMAYQSYGQGVALADVRALIGLIRLKPDITFLLELAENEAKKRILARASGTDRYEEMDAAFFARVQTGFACMAAAEPERFLKIDASPAPGEVVAALRLALREKAGR
ncbi:dTMP kinase [Acidocella aminolytica]|uniref:Thymidylate kinase n=1 Tax=Acidocella aminolytica 101 = DSM 11237 TaxID=1120923 RepID=A0A0D6PCC9_9PROT|nr:dTMP kinase [Acidocella aminolytica]GAN79415.1 thymidylate(dTMP) kinase [Acidocella aminolytica 101 = DSM 11237]GBQ43869.1 thymidylate kinase [Acidocella aminolytica 101 = DSM 11237]SHE45376.1 thymidylate kinase [Acidocella aminolytica 101 = DSM 11237]